MRKLKVSLICTLAALLCCTLFAFIGVYAQTEAQNTLNTNTETAEEISAHEHEATSGGLLTEQSGDGISAPEREAKATRDRNYGYTWPEWSMVNEDYERETDNIYTLCHSYDFDYYSTIYAYGNITIPMGWIMSTWGEPIFNPSDCSDFYTYADSKLSFSYEGSNMVIDTSAMSKGDRADIRIDLPDNGYWDFCQGQYCMRATDTVELTIIKCDITQVKTPYVYSTPIEGGRATLANYDSTLVKITNLPSDWSLSGTTLSYPAMKPGEYTFTASLKSKFDRSKNAYYSWDKKKINTDPKTISVNVVYQYDAPLWDEIGGYDRVENQSNFGAGTYYTTAYISEDIIKLGSNDYFKQYFGWDFLGNAAGCVTASTSGNLSFRLVDGEVALDLSKMSVGESGTITYYLPTGGYWQWHSCYSENDSSTESFTLTAIKVGTQSPPTITCGTTVVYGETLDLTGTGGVGSYSWSVPWAYATIKNGVLTPKKVGTTTLTLTALGNSTTASAETSVTLTILSKAIAIPTLSKGADVHTSATVEDQTATTKWTGSAQHFTISSTSSLENITFGTPSASATLSGTDFYATAVGTHTVTMSIDSTKYCWGTVNGGNDTADRTLTITIDKADQTPTITGNASVVYESTLPLTGGNGFGKYTWSVEDGTGSATIDPNTGLLTPVKAGTVTVTLTAAGDTTHEEGTATKEIEVLRKAIAVPTLSEGNSVATGATVSKQTATTPYNGEAQHFIISSLENIIFGEPTTGATRFSTDFYATEAGEYTVTMDLDYDKYCWGDDDITQKTLKIKITKATQTVTITSTASSVVWGSTITMAGSGESTGAMKWTSSDTTVATVDETTGVVTPVKAGKVIITLTVAEDETYYKGTATKEIEVQRKAIEKPTLSIGEGAHHDATVDQQTATTTYNGEAQHFTISGSTENITFGTPSSTNATLNGTDFYATQAGNYTVSMTIDPDKYCWGSTDGGERPEKINLTLKINKGTQTPKITGESTVEYGSTITLTGTGVGTATWSSSDETVATVDADGIVTALSVGKVTITFTVGGDQEVGEASATKIITVTAKNISGTTVSLSKDSYTYDGEAKTPVVTVTDGTKTLTKDVDYTVAYTDNTNVGTAHVTVTGTGNYTGSATKNFTINATTMNADFTYGTVTYGSASAAPEVKNNVSGGTVSWTVEDGSGSATIDADTGVLTPVTAGTVSVTMTIEANGIYAKYTKTKPITIIATLTLDLTYGTVTYGSTASPTLTGNDGKGTPKYTVTDGSGSATIDEDTGVLTPTAAGTVTVTVNVPATANYAAGSKTVTVTITAKGISSATVTAPSAQTYTGSAIEAKPVVKDGDTTLVENVDYTLAYADNVNAGTATITVTGKGNYGSETTTSFAINKAPITVTLSYGKVTYGEDSEAPSVGGNDGNGEVSFTVEADSGSANINASTGVLSPTAAGTVNVTVTIAESTNYLGGSKTVNVNIYKAKPTATVAVVDGKYYVGDMLSSVTISVTDSKVEGTVKWNNAETAKITSTAGSYGWTFTPNDTNYDVLTGTLQVTAFAKVTGITVTGATTKYNANDTFDTTKLKVTASYDSGKEDTVVDNYTIIYPTAGLQHFVIADDGKDVTISYTENGITVTATVTISITAGVYDMDGVSMEDLSLTYDGQYHTLTINGDLPDGVRFKYFTYDGKQRVSGVKDAGTYAVEAVFEIDEPENYKMPKLSATLEIKKAKAQITVSLEGKTFVYDGTEQTIDDIATVNNDEQEIKYSGNTFTNVPKNGTLKVIVSVEESDNYLAAKQTVTITISKAQAKINTSKVKTDYVYDGTLQKVESGATVNNDEQEVQYSDNTFKDVPENGKQTVTISVEETDNYLAASTTVEITIDKAKVENVLKFADKEVTYNGATRTITVEGELGDDLTVVYYYTGTEDEFKGETNVKYEGENYVGYGVTAHFVCTSGNYYEPKDMTATLTIKPYEVTKDNIKTINDTYGYTGAPVKPDFDVKVTMANGETTLEKTAYTVAYSTEVYTVGTKVTVTVTVNIDGNIVGTVEKEFTITKATITVVWDEKGGYVYNNTRQGVGVTAVNGFTASDAEAFTYTVTYTGRGDTTYSSTSKPKDAGLYTVTVAFGEGAFDNYQLASEDALSKQFEIKKATVTLTVKVADHGDLYEGGMLPAISIDGVATAGELTVIGKLAWQQSGDEPIALEYGAQEYVWVFTPNDTNNFNVKTDVIEFTAGQATVESITVGWRTDVEIPTIYTSTTLTEIRDYISVKGVIAGKQTEIALYEIVGDWGKTPNPDTGDEGEHVLTVSFKGCDATITVNYQPIGIEDLKIEAATPGGITKNYKGLAQFDKNSIVVTVVFSDGTEKVVTNYTVIYNDGHTELWAGDEEVTISYNNGSLSEPITHKIDGLNVVMNDYDMSGIVVENYTTDYDGTAKAYKIKGNFTIGEVICSYQKMNAQGVLETVLPENVKNAGTYQVTVSFKISDGKYAANYYDTIASKEVELTIRKIEYTGLKDIAFENNSIDYGNGKPLATQIENMLKNVPAGVEVSFEYSDANGVITEAEVVNAGNYTVTVKFKEDGNHFAISPLKINFEVKKLKPAIEPAVGGSIVAGTLLNQLTFTDNLGTTAGTLKWVNEKQELKDGVNRCYYVFTPDDTVNFETVRGYVDLEVGVSSSAGEAVSKLVSNFPDWAWYVLLGAALLAIVLALIGIAIAKKKPTGDNDGFYDEVTEADLQ